ncbi:GNAT family N-acetyltransferase [Jatrophihabitans sp. DSM 45814]
MTPDITVRNNTESRTYEAVIDDQVVGLIIYEVEGPRIALTHTIVEPEYRRQGIATMLVRGALDDIRASGVLISVFCNFVSHFVSAHPEYADLIDANHPGVSRPG